MTLGARRLAPVLVLIGLALAACSNTVAGVPSIGSGGGGSASSAPATSTDIGPVPAGLEAFYTQTLDWGSCADLATSEETKLYRAPSLQCADLTVPLSYDDPSGPTITLKVLRKPATDQANRIGSVITDPGGPGGSGVENAGIVAAYGLAKDVNARLDFVGFDPRGVGFSTPSIQCQTDAERDATRATTIRTRTPEEVQAANALSQQLAEGCATLSGSADGIDGSTFLATVGTANVAKDMDVLRAALGDRQLTYIGWSYGTSIGTEYARQFPENVRAMILDGAIDPNQDQTSADVSQSQAFQQAFDDYAAWCATPDQLAKHPCPLGTDPAQATATYQALVRPLLDKPLPLTGGRVLTFNDAVTGTFNPLYSRAAWPDLSDALTALSRGSGNTLMAQADSYFGRDSNGHYGNLQDAFLAITCIDGTRADPATDPQLAQKRAEAAPFMASGDPPAAVTDPCGFWPVPPVPLQPVNGVAGLPTVLVISTTHDPATPYQSGVNLADDLGARLMTVNGTNHTAYLGTGNSCVDDIGNDYLLNLTLPDEGTTC